MESTSVNWEALDSLVIDFAKSENLIENFRSSPSPPSSPSSSSSSASSSSSYNSRLLIRQIRKYIELGDIDCAIDLLRIHAPFILDDHRLLFRLQKQKFIELLRRGTAKDRDCAIECVRNALAPCALDAYPEAYEEFKHVLLAFIYDKDDRTSPVANEWSERRRFEIAGLMSSVLRAQLHAYDPVFALALRYLISIHKGFCLHQGMSSPISNLTERLLLEEHDAAATPQEIFYEAPPFDEVDIQALAHAVELTRQGAVDSLKFAKGDLFLAFQNELCRMRFDAPVLDELVREYCIYRGIVDSGARTFYGSSIGSQPQTGYSSSVDYGTSKHSDGETSVGNTNMDYSPEVVADSVIKCGSDVEVRYPSGTKCGNEDCSTSGTHQLETSRVLPSRVYVSGERSRRKRWRGRQDNLDFVPDISLYGTGKQECDIAATADNLKEQQASEKSPGLELIKHTEDKYEILLGMKELADRGMAAEVVEEINALDPNFFVQNPILLFQLKQVEFLKLVSSGDYSSALRVACSHLGPLAASDPAFLKPLKETLLALLRPNEEAFGKSLPLQALATSMQVAVGRRLGIEEPQLMKIMRATLYTHTEWFKLQMCKDGFEGLLRIDSLKETSSNLTADTASKSNADNCTHGSSQVTVSSNNRTPEDGGSTIQASSSDLCDENAILKVMEFLALPRADAIHLLAQYNGNAETVIQQIFA
ncbi:CTLH/CRA C-terminal to LisH motif domain [Dillenia turbinata]|uniref:CTLH/CRA C-terminal to LisH motif domain n=1 Tax=Dillenia turbinata TaxID=194707 RepID=A0AAN8Z2I1_9MAGN